MKDNIDLPDSLLIKAGFPIERKIAGKDLSWYWFLILLMFVPLMIFGLWLLF